MHISEYQEVVIMGCTLRMNPLQGPHLQSLLNSGLDIFLGTNMLHVLFT